MKKSLLRSSLVIVGYVFVATFPSSCRWVDHVEPLSCERASTLLTACTKGWRITSTKENGVVSARIAPYAACGPEAPATEQIIFFNELVDASRKRLEDRCVCPLCGFAGGLWNCDVENQKLFLTLRRYGKFNSDVVRKREIKELSATKMVLGFTENGVVVEEIFECQ